MNIHKLIALPLLLAATTLAADWALVANPAVGVTSVSKADLKRVYTGKKTSIGSAKVVPMMVVETNPAVAAFLAEVLGMTPAEFKKFWVETQIKGEGTAPPSQKTSMAAVAVVSEIPAGIAIVEKSAVTGAVKEIAVQ